MHKTLVRVYLALVALAAAHAQDRLVNLHVVALDSHDHPVHDLTADDFQIQEQGRNARIVIFRKSDPKAGVAEPALGPHEFSNHVGSMAASATVILFDLLHPMDEKFARAQLTKAAANFRADDGIYLYLLTARGPLPVRGLTEQGTEDVPAGVITQGQMDAAFDAAKRINLGFSGPSLIDLTYLTLQGMASRLAVLPGRKSMVWITRGVPLSFASEQPGYSRDFTDQARQLIAMLQAGNIALYPVGDARREIGSQSMGTLNEFASKTGGRSHMDMDVGTAIREAMDDSKASYTLGFDTPNRDGKYHKVHVSCARGGVHILTQDGYYASDTSGPGEEERMVEGAKRSPLDAGEIGVRAIVSPSKKNPQAVRLSIRIDANDIQMARSETGYEGHVSVTLVAFDAGGLQTILKQTGYPFHMTAEQHQDAMKNGIKLSPDQPLTDDAVQIRIIVFDRSSNAIGWLTVPVTSEDRSAKQ
jgi:VWFA-related protein